jgi:hypothetical protein
MFNCICVYSFEQIEKQKCNRIIEARLHVRVIFRDVAFGRNDESTE